MKDGVIPQAAAAPLPDDNDLCTDCALCCSGALFDVVPVPEAEAQRVDALGLDVVRRESDIVFRQPCVMLRDKLCAVYGKRPSACRTFRCTLLKNLDAGAISFREAKRRIYEARAMSDEARKFFTEGENIALARQRWKRGLSPAGGIEAARFQLIMTAFNRFLDRHFRPERERQVLALGGEGRMLVSDDEPLKTSGE